VLELSKLEAGRLSITPAPFDLIGTLADLDGLFRLRADARHITFSVHISPTLPRYVIGDEGRLRQILINLLSNALKFTHTGTVTVEADAREANGYLGLRITVADTGEGVAPDELDSLFTPFMQTESGRRAREGTGLGLALSREIACLMGGDITVTSTPGIGSIFTVEVLVEPTTSPPELPGERHITGLVMAGRRYRALVADSQTQSRQIMAEWLHEAGCAVREAADGIQALSCWATWHPHIVLIDQHMPVIDGNEVIRRIKASPGGRATVVIALTSDSEHSIETEWQTLDCDDFLPIPTSQDELLACVGRHLGLDVRYLAEAPLKQADLAELPTEVRAQLGQAAALSDPILVEAAVARVSANWPALGERLAALAAEFQFELIELLALGSA
jgi:CheY-like chemotaxis protein